MWFAKSDFNKKFCIVVVTVAMALNPTASAWVPNVAAAAWVPPGADAGAGAGVGAGADAGQEGGGETEEFEVVS